MSGDGAARVVNFSSRRSSLSGTDPWEAEIRGPSPIELRDRALFAAERTKHVSEDGVIQGVHDSPSDSEP